MTRDRANDDQAPGAQAAGAPGAAEAGLDRRTLLTAAGSAVVAGLGIEASRPAAAAPTSYRRIDAHTHFSSLKVLDALEKEDGKPFVLGRTYRSMRALTDAQARLALPD